MARKLSAWNIFVKKVYNENKHKPNYKFKDALKELNEHKRRVYVQCEEAWATLTEEEQMKLLPENYE